MRAIVDIEADGLLDTIQNIWCIVVKDIDTNEFHIFNPSNMDKFKDFAGGITEWIGHNFINYDARAIERILGIKIPLSSITDTLVLSRLVFPVFETGGGHSLEDWGIRLKFPKMDFNDWSKYSPEMEVYCQNDVELNHKVYDKLQRNLQGFSQRSIRLEHNIRFILDRMQDNGFKLDEERAQTLFVEITEECRKIEETIQNDYPPRKVYVQKYRPRMLKAGGMTKKSEEILKREKWDLEQDELGEYYHIYEMRPFNLASPKDIRERMEEAGWSPVIYKKPSKTQLDKAKEKGINPNNVRGHPELCEENFETLPENAPQSARNIARWMMLISRVRTIKQWFEALSPLDGCVHGRVLEIGANTHRMAHQAPNMANISKVKLKKITNSDGSTSEVLAWGNEADYRTDMRACWITRDLNKRCLVGADLSGIQLRAFAHYANNQEYINQILSGDIHSWNREILVKLCKEFCDQTCIDENEIGFLTKNDGGRRNDAKTFIYAYLFGAGNKKVGTILGFPAEYQNKGGKFIRDGFVTSIQGLDVFKAEIKRNAKKGYMTALDGRLIKLPSEHFALSIYLQSFEAIVMKTTMLKLFNKCKKLGLDVLFAGVIHDELQMDVLKEHAEQVGKLFQETVREVGVEFKCNIPLDSEYKTGPSWASTH